MPIVLMILVAFGITWSSGDASLQAQEVLNQSASKYQSSSGLEVSFKVKSKNMLTEDVSLYSGELVTGAQGQFKLKTPSIEMYSDATTFWDYRPIAKQVLIKNFADVGMKFGPSQVLLQYLECKPKSMKVTKLNGKDVYHIILQPSEKLQQFAEIEVWLGTQDLAPIQMRTVDYSENQVDYNISTFKVISTPAKSVFQWMSINGVEVIDMR